MPSNNVIMTMVAIAMILLGTALVLYASWMFTTKDTCTCPEQTTMTGGGGQTTVAPVTFPPCPTGFKRIDQTSKTCYTVNNFEPTDASCNFILKTSKVAVVYTPDENARVQAFIDSLTTFNTGFFYVGVKYTTKWVKSDGITALTATESFFDVGQFEGAGVFAGAFMKKRGNGFWYQNNGQQPIKYGYYSICQI